MGLKPGLPKPANTHITTWRVLLYGNDAGRFFSSLRILKASCACRAREMQVFRIRDCWIQAAARIFRRSVLTRRMGYSAHDQHVAVADRGCYEWLCFYGSESGHGPVGLLTIVFSPPCLRDELFQVGIHRIAGRDDADRLAVFNHGHMPESILLHQQQRVPV